LFAPDGLYYSVDDYYDDLKALDDYPMQHTEQSECERVAFLTVEKPFLACFSGLKTVLLPHFSLESEPTEKLPFPVRSPPVFYPLRRYENKWDFHQLMSTKSKMQSRRFCSQKKKQAVSLVGFGKSDTLFLAKPSLFFPYFDFTLIGVYISTGIK